MKDKSGKFISEWKNEGSKNTSKFSGLYRSWKNMLIRAGNSDGKNPTYSDVSVCDRWLSYDNFFDDMSSTWFKGATLDKDIIKPGNRIYCPEYCKWVSKSENISERNKRVKTKSGSLNPASKKVKCIETGEIFDCCRDAERKYNTPAQAVSSAANPNCVRNKTAAGYHWEYVR